MDMCCNERADRAEAIRAYREIVSDALDVADWLGMTDGPAAVVEIDHLGRLVVSELDR